MKDQRQSTRDLPRELHVEGLFARRLRDLRDDLGISQVKLADRLTSMGLKIDDLAILRMEKNADDPGGGRRIRLGEAAVISRALGVRLDEMLRDPSSIEDRLVKLRDHEAAARGRLTHAEETAQSAKRELESAQSQIQALQDLLVEEEQLTKAVESMEAEGRNSEATAEALRQIRTLVEEQIELNRKLAAAFFEHRGPVPKALRASTRPEVVAALRRLDEAMGELERLDRETRAEVDLPDLTVRQGQILEVIRSSVARLGYPPSVQMIGDAVGIDSTAVEHQLQSLRQKGYLGEADRTMRADDLDVEERRLRKLIDEATDVDEITEVQRTIAHCVRENRDEFGSLRDSFRSSRSLRPRRLMEIRKRVGHLGKELSMLSELWSAVSIQLGNAREAEVLERIEQLEPDKSPTAFSPPQQRNDGSTSLHGKGPDHGIH